VDIHKIPREKKDVLNPIAVGPNHGEEDE
jgi:hypothetical protein